MKIFKNLRFSERRHIFGFDKLFKKKKIVLPKVLPFKKKPTLEEIGLSKRFSEPPYFRILTDNELTLFLKSPIGVKERKFKLPLRPFEIIFISTKVGGNKKFWEDLMITTLRNHWKKYG